MSERLTPQNAPAGNQSEETRNAVNDESSIDRSTSEESTLQATNVKVVKAAEDLDKEVL